MKCKMKSGLVVLALVALVGAGCIGYVAKTGYYAYKGAEGILREIDPIENPPIIPDPYKAIALPPLRAKDLGRLAEQPSFREQMKMYQEEAKGYFKIGWPTAVMAVEDLDEARDRNADLALVGTVLDYNHGSQAQKAGIGEFHTLFVRYDLVAVKSGNVLGTANIEGRVRVTGHPVQGLAKGMELWLFKYADPSFRETVRQRREAHDKN